MNANYPQNEGKGSLSFDVIESQGNTRDLQKLTLKYCCADGIWLPAGDVDWLNVMNFSSETKTLSWRVS